MLSSRKRLSDHIGRGCVYWRRDACHRPVKVRIIGLVQTRALGNTIVGTAHGDRNITENVAPLRFVAVDPQGARHEVVASDLFDNFLAYYKYIYDNVSLSYLEKLGSYGVVREYVNCVSWRSKVKRGADLLSKLMADGWNGSPDDMKRLEDALGALLLEQETRRKVDYETLNRHTLYPFIVEMRRRYPEMGHRLDGVSFATPPNGTPPEGTAADG